MMAGLHGLQPPGTARFQPSVWPQPPGFRLDHDGFRVGGTSGEVFRFLSDLGQPQLVAASPDRATYLLASRPRCPSAVELSLAAPGFTLKFRRGLGLGFASEDSPRLTTEEVTVDAPNPTPPTRWVLVNFVEAQVPVLLVFDRPVSAVLAGRPKDWTLTTLEPYSGDVQVRLPLGTVKLKSQVADLGAAVHLIKQQEAVWLGPPPHFKSLQFAAAKGGVNVTWVFDRPYAVVPWFLSLADPSTGIAVNDEVVVTDADLEDAPQVFANGTQLTAFFPARTLLNSAPLVVSEAPVGIRPVKPDPGGEISLGDFATGLLDASTFDAQIARSSERALVAAFRKTPEELGRGALLNAAIGAQKRLANYRAERGISTPAPPVTDPLFEARDPAYSVEPSPAASSPLRLNGDGAFTCVPGPAGYVLTWKPSSPGGTLQMAAPWPFELSDAKGVSKLEPKPGKPWFTLTLTPQQSEAQVSLVLPKGNELPKK